MRNLLALLLFMPSLCLAQIPDYVPADGLMAFYALDGNALDASPHANHGAMTSVAFVEDRFGNPQGSAYFSGASCTPRMDAMLDLSSADSIMTVSFFVKKVGNGCSNPRIWEFWSSVYANNMQCAWFNSSSATIGVSGAQISEGVPSADEWYHFAVVATVDSTWGYQNGQLTHVTPINRVFPLIGDLAIGRMNHPAWDAFNGCIDEFGVWNRGLSPEEIAALANFDTDTTNTTNADNEDSNSLDSLCMPTDSLVTWFPFDGDALDASGNDNDGVIYGAVPADDRLGNPGGSLEFTVNGSGGWGAAQDRVVVSNPPISDANAFTMVSWIYLEEKPAPFDNRPHTIMGRWSGNGQSVFRFQAYYDGTLMTQIDGLGNLILGSIPYQQWTHVGSTFDGQYIRHYINGDLAGSLDLGPDAQLPISSSDLTIGELHMSNGHWYLFSGRLEDVGYYDRALSDEEVLCIALGATPISGCTDPTACNYDSSATVDDGSCLLTGGLDLEECLEVTEDGELVLTVPSSLSSFAWEDGSSSPSRPIGVGGEFILTATVGDLPSYGASLEDGLVFHIDTANQEAYLATPTQVGDGAQFGCKFTITGAWGTAMGDGLANTEVILDACADPTIAAAVASNVGPGWFLPSQAELDAIRTRLHDAGFGAYFTDNTDNWYWPSTECEASPADAAGSMHFTDGFYATCNNKDSNPGGVIAAKRIPLDLCFVSDTLFIATPCTSATLEPACGEGTVWDPVNEECIIAIPADLNYDGCVSVNDLLVLLTVHGTCPPYPEWPDEPTDTTWICGDPVTYWDYDYATVLIGDQCWFAENLRTEQYATGDSIPYGLTDGEWASTTTGATAVFGEGSSNCINWVPEILDACNDLTSLEAYGRLYNWYAVDDIRNLCAAGWHVASDDEWTVLENFVGEQGFSGIEGEVLKSTYGWYNNGNGSNEFGFKVFPAGNRNFNDAGTFRDVGWSGYFWRSTSIGDDALGCSLSNNYGHIHHQAYSKRNGFSVRCLKD